METRNDTRYKLIVNQIKRQIKRGGVRVMRPPSLEEIGALQRSGGTLRTAL